tara:strand:+ start:572 stop:976 length:405 start_codon:yes stop_codon:yes gene_type:complete
MATKTGLPETREELVQILIDRKQPMSLVEKDCCSYLHSSNGGCAIGVAVTKSTAIKLEITNSCITYKSMLKILPKRLSSMGSDFLSDVQEIHDNEDNWWNYCTAKIGENGLIWNDEGVGEIKKVIEKYKLDLKI